MSTRSATRLSLKPSHKKLAERLVKSGRFASTNDVVVAAMSLLEAQEKDYAECVEGVRRGLADAAAGRETDWDDFRREFETRRGLRRAR